MSIVHAAGLHPPLAPARSAAANARRVSPHPPAVPSTAGVTWARISFPPLSAPSSAPAMSPPPRARSQVLPSLPVQLHTIRYFSPLNDAKCRSCSPQPDAALNRSEGADRALSPPPAGPSSPVPHFPRVTQQGYFPHPSPSRSRLRLVLRWEPRPRRVLGARQQESSSHAQTQHC